MEVNELVAYLTEGLTAEEAAVVRKSVERDNVKSKVSGLKQQSEFDALQARAQALQEAMDGGPNKPGAKAYQEWYDKNYAAVQKLQADNQKYQEKYGTLEAPKAAPAEAPVMTKEDIQRMVDERWQGAHVATVATGMKKFGNVIQRHIMSGRKTPLDIEALDKLMGEKGLDIEKAYEEYDKPEREKEQKAAAEAEIERRVAERIQQENSRRAQHGSEEFHVANGPLSAAPTEKFDERSLMEKMANDIRTLDRVQ